MVDERALVVPVDEAVAEWIMSRAIIWTGSVGGNRRLPVVGPGAVVALCRHKRCGRAGEVRAALYPARGGLSSVLFCDHATWWASSSWEYLDADGEPMLNRIEGVRIEDLERDAFGWGSPVGKQVG